MMVDYSYYAIETCTYNHTSAAGEKLNCKVFFTLRRGRGVVAVGASKRGGLVGGGVSALEDFCKNE